MTLSSDSEDEKVSKAAAALPHPPDLSSQAARKRMERAMREQESRPLFTGVAVC
jgi:hypothetical protein